MVAGIRHEQATLESLQLAYLPADLDAPARLQLDVARLVLPALGQDLQAVRFECEPQLQARPEGPGGATWSCRGPVRWRGGGSDWTLAWTAGTDLSTLQVRLAQGRSELEISLPLGGRPLSAQARQVPAGWLQLLAPQLQWQAGHLDGRVEQAKDAGWSGQVQVGGLAAQSSTGDFAVADIALSGGFELRRDRDGRLAVRSAAVLGAGEMLAGPVYAGWPAGSRVQLDLDLLGQGGRWQVGHLRVEEPGFSGQFEGLVDSGSGWITQARARIDLELAQAYGRYLDGLMVWLGQRDVSAAGRLEVDLGLGAGGHIRSFDARFHDVSLRHPGGRFDLAGVEGNLAFRDDGDSEAQSSLRWQRLGLTGLPLEAGHLQADSRGGQILAREPVVMGLFGGSVLLEHLRVRPLARQGERVTAEVELRDIDLTSLATAYGWPAFPGRLDARLPRLYYAGERLAVEGRLEIEAFDGDIEITALSIERPFGVAPALGADIRLRGLDLVPLTEVFGFGRIEGRLDGHILGLRLLDWRPVAFDARLLTQDSGRRRISQLAVEQLTRLGGGGVVAGLQGRLLGAFDSFAYRRIGLSCRLANDVCEMGGIEGDDGSYTILQGSGLPQITIRGFQRRVDWPVLVGRVQSMLRGSAPTVE